MPFGAHSYYNYKNPKKSGSSGGSGGDFFSKYGKYGGLLFPILFGLSDDTPQPPELPMSSAEDIGKFYNIKRYLGQSQIQRQGARTAKGAASTLPASLRESTVPASIQAEIGAETQDKLSQLESQLTEAEMDDLMSLAQIIQQQYGLELQADQQSDAGLSDALSIISMLAFL